MKQTWLALGLLAICSSQLLDAMEMPKYIKYVDVTFVNAARHTISVLTNWKNKKEVAARDLEAGQRVPFENVNLDEIESFTITFKKGWRPLYGYIPGIATEITINAAELSQLLAQKNAHTVDITINPHIILSRLVEYVVGFERPTYNFLTKSRKPAKVERLEESFIGLAEHFPVARENELLYSEAFGLSPLAKPHEILQIEAPPADPQEAKKFALTTKGGQYLFSLNEKMNNRLKEFAEGSVERDKIMKERFGIEDFSKKVSAIILGAFHSIANHLKAR